ncbi:hypothetical protein BHK69_18840 [Bosea vaviloviae]|uniref:Uncharacterized protein n=1 Tax=Bosea vaviloviae TaxID=1526658 RepID=A0A1D7U4C5_9HYPH|nr:hypothetical protein BHK69_18840 [Bosea vaviloviae]
MPLRLVEAIFFEAGIENLQRATTCLAPSLERLLRILKLRHLLPQDGARRGKLPKQINVLKLLEYFNWLGNNQSFPPSPKRTD